MTRSIVKLSYLITTSLIAGSYLSACWADGIPTVNLDLGKPGAPVAATFYGLMTEEINYSYEGGIYAELIQNRIFRDNTAAPAHWAVVQDGGGKGAISLDESQPIPGTVLARCLKLDASQASPGHRAGIANDGYWGIPVKPKTTYRASFYAKSDSASHGPLTVSIESNDGAKVLAAAQVPQITNQWQKYTAMLTTVGDVAPSAANRFVISTEKPGAIWFNLVSLFPPTYHDRPNGNRIDIMQILAEMKPAFLRLPGRQFPRGGDHRGPLSLEENHRPARTTPRPSRLLALWSIRRAGTAGIPGMVRGFAHPAGARRVCGLFA